MGNKIGRRRQAVDERYTRPQGLYQHKDVDHKKLRRLILDSKLAPCYPGDEDYALDLEECPICFLYYPSLNRSRCCTKGICTECFLQMKPPHSARPTQCPFCKTSNYAVEYRGVRTKEEKGMEQLEEQKVIEAQIRMRRQELQEEEERKQKRKEVQEEERKQMRKSLSNRIAVPTDVDHCDIGSSSLSVSSFRYPPQADEFASSQGSCTAPVSTRHSHLRQNREDNFDMDLEDIMVMEAIWLSIQDHGASGNPACCGNSALPGPSFSEECYNSHTLVPLEPSPGQLACAAAALAERQHMNNGLSVASSSTSAFDMSHRSAGLPVGENHVMNYPSYPPENWIEVPPENGRAGVPGEDGEWAMENRSDMAEAGTSYASSDIAADSLQAASPLQEGANLAVGHHLVPESFEEQMMLAMAVSLAEARARTNPQGVTWL